MNEKEKELVEEIALDLINAQGQFDNLGADVGRLIKYLQNRNPCDIDEDGIVGASDLALLAANWDSNPTIVPPVIPSDWPPIGQDLIFAKPKYTEYNPVRTLTWPIDTADLHPGDAVIFPSGTYTGRNVLACSNVYGADDNPIVFLADGEVILQGEASGILVKNGCRHVIFDGFTIDHYGAAGQGGIYGFYYTDDIIFRNIKIRDWNCGIRMMDDLHGITIENCTMYGNLGSHGIYLGARGNPGTDITIRDCVIRNSGMHGIQHNGRITGLRIEDNVIHSNSYAGLSLVNGVSESTIRHNLIFNNSRQGIIFHCYDDSPTSGILPYDQTRNIIEDNIIWVGKTSWKGDAQTPKDHAAVHFNDSTAKKIATYTNTLVKNNILAVQHNKAIETGGFDIILDGNREFVDGAETPFADVSVDYWNQPSRFNFRGK